MACSVMHPQSAVPQYRESSFPIRFVQVVFELQNVYAKSSFLYAR